MGVGILEDHKLKEVPGTALFNEDPNAAALAAYAGVDITKLKHATGKHSEIILVPQPSDDPNDPLNWAPWRKHMFFFTTTIGTVCVGVLGPLLSADQPGIAAAFDTSVQGISRILGSWLVLTLAIASIILQVVSLKVGRRPVYLGCTLAMLVGCVGASYTHNLGGFAAARIITAIGMAPLEFLGATSLSDIYFVHERGLPIAVWNAALFAGINCTPPIAGQILQSKSLGWRWALRFFAIFSAVVLVLQFFFMPETRYQRKVNLDSPNVLPGQEKNSDVRVEDSKDLESRSELDLPVKKTFWQECAVFSGWYHTRNSIPMLLLQPFLLLFTPALLCCSLVYGLGITWLVLLATAFAILFGGPPYNFGPSEAGLIYLSPLVFCLLACAVAGPLTNYITRKFSKMNGGIYEPEFKLIPTVFYLIFGCAGLFGFGISLDKQEHWAVPVIFFGLISFGLTLGTSSTVSYLVDMYSRQSDAAIAALIFWKNIYSFALTWNIVDWLIADGVKFTFNWVGGITVMGCVLTIPLYVFGKRLRSATFRLIRFEGETSAAH